MRLTSGKPTVCVRAMKLEPEEKEPSKEERITDNGTMTTTEVTAASSPPPSPASERMTTGSVASPSRDSTASSPPAAPVKQASSDFSVNSLLTSKGRYSMLFFLLNLLLYEHL